MAEYKAVKAVTFHAAGGSIHVEVFDDGALLIRTLSEDRTVLTALALSSEQRQTLHALLWKESDA